MGKQPIGGRCISAFIVFVCRFGIYLYIIYILECDENQRNIVGEDVREEEKAKADFGLSGALSKDTVTGNVYNGVILKWTEPLDAKVPYKGWRLYVFKDNEVVETLHLHHQSAFLFGREARVADHVLGNY